MERTGTLSGSLFTILSTGSRRSVPIMCRMTTADSRMSFSILSMREGSSKIIMRVNGTTSMSSSLAASLSDLA